jgi:hypothetical protein
VSLIVGGILSMGIETVHAECREDTKEHCGSKLSNCTSTIDQKNDPGAADKSKDCYDEYKDCCKANGCSERCE